MREQRYSNVVEKYEAELRKQRTIAEAEDEEEAKLSMTREIKYKDLQEEIDKNDKIAKDDSYIEDLLENTLNEDELKFNKKTKELESSLTEDELEFSKSENKKASTKVNKNEKELKGNDEELTTETEEEPKKIKLETVKSDDDFFEEMKTQRINLPKNDDEEDNQEDKEGKEDKEEKANEKVNITKVNKDDDIYLTTAFEPLKSRLSIGKIFAKIFIFLVIIAALGALVYFVLFPLYNKYFLNSPKKIFETTIDNINTMISKGFITQDDNLDSYFQDISFDIDSNIDGLKELSGYTLNINSGIDFNKNIITAGLYINKDSQKIGFDEYYKDKNSYIKYSTSDKYIYLGEDEDVSTSEIKELINIIKFLGKDVGYTINKATEIIKSLLDEEKLSKEKDVITVDGKNVDVTRNTFKLNSKDAESLLNQYYSSILKDDTVLDSMAKINDMSKEEYRDYLNNQSIELDDDFSASFNIYTIKGNEVVGLDYEEKGFRKFYFYENDAEFDMYINLTDDSKCSANEDCVADNKSVIELNGEKKNSYTEIIIKHNNVKVATLNINEFKEDKIDLEYEFIIDSIVFTGSLEIEMTSNNNTNIFLSLHFSEYYLDLKIDSNLEYNKTIEELSANDYVQYSEEQEKIEEEKFLAKAEELGLQEFFAETNDSEEIVTPPQSQSQTITA